MKAIKTTVKGTGAILLLIFSVTTAELCAQPGHVPAFVKPPELIEDPGLYYKYSADSRQFTGIPSLAVDRDGTMWAVWYAGSSPAEDNNNYVVVASSRDSGSTWEEVLAIDPDGAGRVRAFDPEVWVDPGGRLWVFWAQGNYGEIHVERDGYIAGVWAITLNDPEENQLDWSSPRRLTEGIMMCKPTVLSTGEWMLPVSTWMNSDRSARAVVSADRGASWNIRGSAHVPKEVRTYDEPMIVERNDGSLWMLVRTLYGIGESVSRDRGRTWSDVEPSGIMHPSARFFIRRLRSGNLLLVKHGPVDVKTGRSHLMAFISKDDGRSWSEGLLLDQRPGVSYPDGQQAEDGTIYITYDFSRTGAQQILMTSFTEEDVLAEKKDERIVRVFENRKVVSDGGRE